MRTKLKKVLSGVAALAVAASVAPLLSAAPAGASTHGVLNGSLTMTPPAGDSNQDFLLDPDDPQVCPGDGATDGYRVNSFIVDAANDPKNLTYNSAGPNVTTGFGAALYGSDGGPAYRNANPDIGTANISGIPVFDLAVYGPGTVPAGDYFVGIACTLNGVTETAWQLPITITTNTGDGFSNISYAPTAVAAVPAAPVLDSVTPGNGTIDAAFTPVESNPATTGYTATATPAGGGTPVIQTGTASPITVSGLTNGTQYSVTVHATNTEGNSPESNALTATPVDVNAQPAVGNLGYTDVAPAGSGEILVNWDAPSSGATPTGYVVTVAPTIAGTLTVNNADTSAQITGLTPGTTYQVTVTPLHTAPAYGTAASISATPLASGVTVLEQNVTVTRPAGAVVFTQICEDSQLGTPLTGAAFGTDPCAIAFGVAERIIPGGGAAPYYEATASLNNVQVDANGEDTGWRVTGEMSDFVNPGTGPDRSFSGNQLGWRPRVVRATDGLSVTLGDPVTPGTNPGLGSGATLASADAGSSLGIAEINANLTVRIPMQKKAGEYSGTLTMTATPGV